MKYIIVILAFLLSGCTYEYIPTKYFVVTSLNAGEKGVSYFAEDLDKPWYKHRCIRFYGEIGEYNIGDTLLIVKKESINKTK